ARDGRAGHRHQDLERRAHPARAVLAPREHHRERPGESGGALRDGAVEAGAPRGRLTADEEEAITFAILGPDRIAAGLRLLDPQCQVERLRAAVLGAARFGRLADDGRGVLGGGALDARTLEM